MHFETPGRSGPGDGSSVPSLLYFIDQKRPIAVPWVSSTEADRHWEGNRALITSRMRLCDWVPCHYVGCTADFNAKFGRTARLVSVTQSTSSGHSDFVAWEAQAGYAWRAHWETVWVGNGQST